MWAMRGLYLLLFIAVFGDFLAGDIPIYVKKEGQVYFPVFRQYAVDLGWAEWQSELMAKPWSAQEYESSILPLIPYSAKGLDLENTLRGPFDQQEIRSNRWRHWLGTDKVGRDVAAGMIRGTRIALSIGVIAMGIATLIGLVFGGLAGFFGDDKIRWSYLELAAILLGIFLGIFYGFIVRSYAITVGSIGWQILISLVVLVGCIALAWLFAQLIHRYWPARKKMAIPVDLIVMRFIEIMNSIPALIFLLAILAVLDAPSIFNVMVIIGLISWTGIARFVRAELLRIRSLEYIEAARALGLGTWRTFFSHALPNAISPILVVVAFGIAGAVLVEAFISFLGVGLPPEEITWGKLLSISRSNISAWWLAVFPGFAIFFTITIFNLIGEGLTDAVNPRLQE